MLFFRDDRGHIKKPTATYWGARLLTQEWVQRGDQSHEIYPAVSDARNGNGDQMITVYAVHRPDGLWALLLINKDPQHAYETSVVFRNAAGATGTFDRQLDIFQYSSKQYLLGGSVNNPYPVRADEPEHRVIQTTRETQTQISLPPYSLTVLRGGLDPLGVK